MAQAKSANRLSAAMEDAFSPEDSKKPNAKEAKPSRQKTVLVGGHFSPDVQKQLRMIAAEEGKTNQALIGEALNLLFKKKGKEVVSLQGESEAISS